MKVSLDIENGYQTFEMFKNCANLSEFHLQIRRSAFENEV